MKPITKFGLSQIGNATPQWATYMFRIIFLLLSFGTFMVSDYPGMDECTKIVLLKWFSGINMFAWGLSKLFGIGQIDHPTKQTP
jgi:hypothetical protein